MTDRRAACGCVFRSIEPRAVPGFPGEAIDSEIVEACRVHEDYARREARAAVLREVAAKVRALPAVRHRSLFEQGWIISQASVLALLDAEPADARSHEHVWGYSTCLECGEPAEAPK
jgi:hypothetical protein